LEIESPFDRFLGGEEILRKFMHGELVTDRQFSFSRGKCFFDLPMVGFLRHSN
uniref:GMP_PDE_delta domain-containing protein n=1 Tax=Gongylonema pulchrum TaxID=637853 RepID=A0A183EYL2_9BILA